MLVSSGLSIPSLASPRHKFVVSVYRAACNPNRALRAPILCPFHYHSGEFIYPRRGLQALSSENSENPENNTQVIPVWISSRNVLLFFP